MKYSDNKIFFLFTFIFIIAFLVPLCAYSYTNVTIHNVIERPVVNQNIPWADIIKRVKNGIVMVEASILDIDVLQPFRPPIERIQYGSGFFINEVGYILTNAHVVYRARSIHILTSNGLKRFETELVGMCEEGDIALLKLKNNERQDFIKYNGNIYVLSLTDSDDIKEGENILSLGYPLASPNLTFTEGIVSGFTRKRGDQYQYIQTNSALNKGNSGGPSVDKNGAVIGINRAVIQDAQNIGFMIPIRVAVMLIPQILSNGAAYFPSMGIDWDINDENTAKYLNASGKSGIVVKHVIQGSTADFAGLKRMDVIASINNIDIDFYGEGLIPGIERRESFKSIVNRFPLYEKVNLRFFRDGKEYNKKVKLFKSIRLPVRFLEKTESPDYEIWGGMVLQPLNLNIVNVIAQYKLPTDNLLRRFHDLRNRSKPYVVITHIFQNSQASKSMKLQVGHIVDKIGGFDVSTLNDVRDAIKKLYKEKYILIETASGTITAFDAEAVNNDEIFLRNIHKYSSNRPLNTQLNDTAR